MPHQKSTLVIGGGGFIGGHLVLRLLAGGRRVTVLGRKVQPSNPLPAEVTYVSGSFGNQELLQALLEDNDEVVHLAHATSPNVVSCRLFDDVVQNLPNATHLFFLAAIMKRRLLLVSSGGTVYGNSENLPILETEKIQPISSYGLIKATLERYADYHRLVHGLDFVCVRPANAYGEGQLPFSGQGLIATAIGSGISDIPIRIYGQRETIRDYIYVKDLAEGIFQALEVGAAGGVYNVGTGRGIDNLQVVDEVRQVLQEIGHKLKILRSQPRPGDVRGNVLDCRKLQRLTGWECRVGFKEGLVRTRDWLTCYIKSK